MTFTTSRRGLIAAAGAIGAATALRTVPGRAQAFPERDLTYVVPYSPGGMSDNISRIIGDKFAATTGKKLLNEYKAGAGGAIGANYYMTLKPDGHSILQSTNSFYAVIPAVTKVQYDPKADLTPLVLVGDAPMVIAVNPAVQAKTLPELIAFAKANPGKIAYSTAGRGTVGHLCGMWLARRGAIDILHVPYNGAGEAIQACLSGETQLFFGPEAAEYILAGKLRGLALMGDKRWDTLPDLPGTVEAGIPGWAPRSWHTVTIHSKAPEPIKRQVAKLLNDILSLPDVRERLVRFGLIPGIEDLAAMRKRADDDFAEFGGLIVDAGMAIKK
ncbi:MAG: tripartite tricarboxylate transporter substrate binding protein [Alphaproteobacteria bacterium]|nr:tripartite tricarboxylate transporter substrate binding protein [Alphaproteobacteria bacterium]